MTKQAAKQTAPAPAQAGPTTEDLQTDAALAGGDPAFVDHAEDANAAAEQHGLDSTAPEQETQVEEQTTPAPAQIKVKMKTVSAGPNPAENWQKGSTRFVSHEEAEALVDADLAELT